MKGEGVKGEGLYLFDMGSKIKKYNNITLCNGLKNRPSPITLHHKTFLDKVVAENLFCFQSPRMFSVRRK